MSKKQIVKNIKKNQKESSKNIEKDGFYKFVTTITGILLILIACYLIIGIFITKQISFNKDDDKKDENTTETVIDNSTITAGQIFDKKDSSYYVVIYDVDSKLTNIGTFISMYSSSDNAIPVYTVDSANKLNSNFITDGESNKNPTSYDNLKIKAPTLIKIQNGSVSDYIEGEENIKAILKNN